MKNATLLAMLLIIKLLPLEAQKSKDVLYLKNGSKIYGKLIEIAEGQYKIKTTDGSLFIYPLSDVEKFVNEVIQFDGRKKSGLGFVLEAGVLAGVKTTEYSAPFSFNILANSTSNTKNIFGLGTGVEFIGQSYMPVFFEYKYLISTKKTTPFVFMRAGQLLHLKGDSQTDLYYNPYDYERNYKGGLSFAVGTGVSWANEDNETYLSFAYRNLHTSYTERNYNTQIATYRNTMNRLEIKFGFRF